MTQKKTWNIINSVLKQGQTRKKLNIKSLFHNNILYESNEEISNTFKSYFSSIGNQIKLFFFQITTIVSVLFNL